VKCTTCKDIYWTSPDAVDMEPCEASEGMFGRCNDIKEKHNYADGMCLPCHEKLEEEERRAKEQEAAS